MEFTKEKCETLDFGKVNCSMATPYKGKAGKKIDWKAGIWRPHCKTSISESNNEGSKNGNFHHNRWKDNDEDAQCICKKQYWVLLICLVTNKTRWN